ncbi:MAG: protealysin inhibitor emfourin [Anaerolineae bacterium]
MVANRIPKWSLSVARLSLSAGLILAAWLLSTCGAPSSTRSEGASSGDVLVEYRLTGGIAGLNDHLIVRSTGEVILENKDGVREVFTVDEAVVGKLQQTVEETGFFDLESEYRPARIIPDALTYQITFQADGRRHTVETSDGAIPEQLAPIIDELNQIIAKR